MTRRLIVWKKGDKYLVAFSRFDLRVWALPLSLNVFPVVSQSVEIGIGPFGFGIYVWEDIRS